jgi:transposase
LTTLFLWGIISPRHCARTNHTTSRPKHDGVRLNDEERNDLNTLLRKGHAKARTLTRARILLRSDEGKTDPAIADALKINPQTVRNIRKRFAEEGLHAALTERPRPSAQRKLDTKQEAFLIALACSAPPEGRECWTMQLLADRLIELGVVATISDETVRRTLKKTRSSRGRSSRGVWRK